MNSALNPFRGDLLDLSVTESGDEGYCIFLHKRAIEEGGSHRAFSESITLNSVIHRLIIDLIIVLAVENNSAIKRIDGYVLLGKAE